MITALTICALLLPGQASPKDAAPVGDSSTPSLPKLISTYFETHDAKARRSLVDRIAARTDGDFRAVIAALQNAQLWRPVESPNGSLAFVLPSGSVIETHYRVPATYDATKAMPTILLVDNGDAAQTIAGFAARLGDHADSHILVCPQRWPGATFHHPANEAVEFREMLVAIRRAFHTDTDRWYLCGEGPAGDTAWLAAILHRDVFAGLFVSDAYPKMPHAEHLYPILLPNLADTQVLSVWQRPASDHVSPRSKTVAAHNHAVLDLARHRFVRLAGIEKPSVNGEPPWPAPEKLEALLSSRRPPTSDRTSHWFRYAGQGYVGPLTQTQYRGGEWTSSQLSILPGASIDRDAYTSDVLKEHLAYLEYRREGDIYRLTTRNAARISLGIPYSQLDAERPVRVYCNGAIRHDKSSAPNLRTLLENAYATWDFQRPVAAEISFSIRRDQP